MDRTERLEYPSEDPTKVFVMGKGTLAKLLGVPQLFAIGFGDVGSSIYYAQDGGFDLIVLGAKAPKPASALDATVSFVGLGRVSDAVVKGASCRVCVLKT
ncbi:MAG: hypothetical protein AAB091_00265 [Elusimicrobiota bacterium]